VEGEKYAKNEEAPAPKQEKPPQQKSKTYSNQIATLPTKSISNAAPSGRPHARLAPRRKQLIAPTESKAPNPKYYFAALSSCRARLPRRPVPVAQRFLRWCSWFYPLEGGTNRARSKSERFILSLSNEIGKNLNLNRRANSHTRIFPLATSLRPRQHRRPRRLQQFCRVPQISPAQNTAFPPTNNSAPAFRHQPRFPGPPASTSIRKSISVPRAASQAAICSTRSE